MSNAKATIKFVIFDALISNPLHPDDTEIIRDTIFESIFAPDVRWAIEEYLQEVNKNRLPPCGVNQCAKFLGKCSDEKCMFHQWHFT